MCREVESVHYSEKVHRLYLIDNTGAKHLAAEGRKPHNNDPSISVTYSPHPQFTEVLSMKSGSSLRTIRKWLQRIIQLSPKRAKAASAAKAATAEPSSHGHDIPQEGQEQRTAEKTADKALPGAKECSKCGEAKQQAEFAQHSHTTGGLYHKCRICVSSSPGKKSCSQCGKRKALSDFARHNYTDDGLYKKCRTCMSSILFKPSKSAPGRETCGKGKNREVCWSFSVGISFRTQAASVA